MAYWCEVPVLNGSYSNLESAFNAQKALGYWTAPEGDGVRTFCGTNLRSGAYVIRCTSALFNTLRSASVESGSCCFLVLSESPLAFSEITRRNDGTYFGSYVTEYSDRIESIAGREYYYTGWYDDTSTTPKLLYGAYASVTDEIADVDQLFNILDSIPLNPLNLYPITYRLTNCTVPTAPTEAVIGDTVTVPFQFTSGYGIVNPSSDVYVTNNGVVVPSQYSNGVLTFTMPDPS